MPSMKAIKRRRVSAKGIQKITKAMNLVATSKLQRARARYKAVQPLFTETRTVMANAAAHDDAQEHAVIKSREVKSVAYVVVTSDRGLCGGYNSNICKALRKHADNKGKDVKIVAVGTKGRDFFRRRDYNVIESYNSPTENASFADAEKISRHLFYLYQTGQIDEICVAYTKFESILSLTPTIEKVLPVDELLSAANPKSAGMEYDPDLNAFIDHMAPLYLGVYIYGAMVEAVICEQASRMTSMDNATKNADDIIEKLTLMFNRQRQSMITQEITEIVSGANALQ